MTKWTVILCQVSAWQSAMLLPISCKSVQPVPSRVEEPVSSTRPSSSAVVPQTIHPFPRCSKPARESRLSKLVGYYQYQCVFRRRRRTRPIYVVNRITVISWFQYLIELLFFNNCNSFCYMLSFLIMQRILHSRWTFMGVFPDLETWKWSNVKEVVIKFDTAYLCAGFM